MRFQEDLDLIIVMTTPFLDLCLTVSSELALLLSNITHESDSSLAVIGTAAHSSEHSDIVSRESTEAEILAPHFATDLYRVRKWPLCLGLEINQFPFHGQVA